MFLPDLNSPLFSEDQWTENGSAGAFEFAPANKYATAVRLDFCPLGELRIGLSGYCGESFSNTLQSDECGKYKDVKGVVTIGTIDMSYTGHGWRIPGGFGCGHLGDADIISTYNRSQSSTSPCRHTLVGNRAHAVSTQAGYGVVHFFPCVRSEKQQLFVFEACEGYDAYYPVAGNSGYEWTGGNRIAFGFSYRPTEQVVVGREYSNHFLRSKFNNEPSISLGITYAGFFL